MEPDPTAFRALSWNIDLNGLSNVGALPVALSDRVGTARMASFGGEKGDSMSSLLAGDDQAAVDVVTMDWATLVQAQELDRVSCVKIDVEGFEFQLLPDLADWLEQQRPTLLLSLHAPYLPEAERAPRMAALAALLAFYDDWRDETGASVDPAELTTPDFLNRFPTLTLFGKKSSAPD